MITALILLILAIAIAIAYWHYGKRHQTEQAKSTRAQQRERNRYHSVEIRPRRGMSCTPAKRHEGIRYLSAEAPRLPLPECASSPCTCWYAHFSDRRQEDRRLDAGPNSFGARVAYERRALFDRRQSHIRPRYHA